MEGFNKKKLAKFKEEILIILESINKSSINLIKNKEQCADDIVNLVVLTVSNHIENCFNIQEEEIFQEVYLCLLEASLGDKSKFNGGFELSVKMLVKEKIDLLILKNKMDIYMSKESGELMRKYVNADIKLNKNLGRIPTIYEIANLLGETSSSIRKINDTYNFYNNLINIGNTNLDEYNFCGVYDEYRDDLRELILNLLDKANITEQELYIVLLYYGIVPNNKSLCYKGKTIYFDGIPKKFEDIGEVFSISFQRCKQLLFQAMYKLATSDEVILSDLTNYTMNPDLTLRMKDIYSWIKTIPYTDKYPDFNAYFKEYSDIEIESVLKELKISDLIFIKQLNESEKNVTDFYYGTRECRRLFIIIRDIYTELIQLYGRRNMITEMSFPVSVKYGQRIDKLRDFYKNFSDYDEGVVTYVVTKLSDYQRSGLYQIFGFDLKRVLRPNEILKLDYKILSNYEHLIYVIKSYLEKLTINGISLTDLEIVTKSSITSFDNGCTGIYQILSLASSNIVDNEIKKLFLSELNVLKIVFGDDLKNNNYDKNLSKLSEVEVAIYYSIMTRIKKKLEIIIKEEQLQLKKNKRIASFYEIFIIYGYKREEVIDVLNSDSGLIMMNEYLKRGTSNDRRQQIIQCVLGMLYRKYGPIVFGNMNGIGYTRKKVVNS